MPMFMPIPPIGPEKHRESKRKCKSHGDNDTCQIKATGALIKLFYFEGDVWKLRVGAFPLTLKLSVENIPKGNKSILETVPYIAKVFILA